MGPSFRRPHLVVALAAMAGGAIPFLPSITACGDKYGENDITSNGADAGGADAFISPTPDSSGAHDASDQDASVGGGACSVSKAPTCGASCETAQLAATAPEDSFPFGITTDANFVYWLTQPPPTATADGISQAYNGLANATILRVTKSGKDKPVPLLTGQPGAKHIVLAGDYLYWVVVRKEGIVTLRRMRRDCASTGTTTPTPACASEDIASSAAANANVSNLVRTGPEAFAVLLTSRYFLRATLATRAFDTSLEMLGDFPAMTANNDTLFFSAASTANVFRAQGSSMQPTKFGDTIPAPTTAGASAGFSLLTTDCASLFAMRNSSAEIFSVSPSGVVLSLSASISTGSAFDIKVDEQYVYVAAPNAGGGMFSVDRQTKSVSHFYVGNVFATHVDDDGVYWGEHAQGGAGAIYMRRK